MKRKQLTKKDLQYIIDNWGEPKPIAQIGKELGMSEATVQSYAGILRRLGVDVPRRSQQGNRLIMKEFAEEWKKSQKVGTTNKK